MNNMKSVAPLTFYFYNTCSNIDDAGDYDEEDCSDEGDYDEWSDIDSDLYETNTSEAWSEESGLRALVTKRRRISVRGDGWRACRLPPPVVLLPSRQSQGQEYIRWGDR